ncbi:MAG TPA: primosomal protein N', partial [Luteimonas sp.]|nr:primosomal protein N' [Luteimonas sp.]
MPRTVPPSSLPAGSTVEVVQVALPVPPPRLFDYAIGAPTAGGLAMVGCRVRVPFGSRELVGVVAASAAPDAAAPELRTVLEWLDPRPLFHGELLASLHWLARYTHAPLGEVFATALPAALRRGEPLPETLAWAWRLTEAGGSARAGLRAGAAPRRLADLLADSACEETLLADRFDGWRAAARALSRRGLAERVAVAANACAPAPAAGPEPNSEQHAAIAAIEAAAGRFQPFLLDGVTGSGKTEVYLQAIAECLARGRQALVLVPEIGLTPQMLARFRTRLGVPVHALHSGLGDGERARVWTAAWRGEARVVVGTRSAVFTPLPEAGLIVVDEEHDASYKQQDGIRYHARDFALVRAKALDIPVVLGSATPSLESLHNARSGRYAHLRLHQRAGAARPPAVRVLDVRKRPLQAGLSPELLAAIARALDAGGQVLVFKNRRGYAPVLLCHDCGWNAPCTRCDAHMTLHRARGRLICHHCGA